MRASRISPTLAFLPALLASLAIYGAIPFLSLPTLGQAIWTSGFAQSFANAGWPAIYATDFGYPNPAPIAFGLAGAFVESTFIALAGLHPADAYCLMTALYLSLALWGALKYAQFLGLRYLPALALATAWVSTPMVWAHTSYSMLSLGIALLPLYLWNGLLLGHLDQIPPRRALLCVVGFIATSILAVFMDGYTYIMFVIGTAVQFSFALASSKRPILSSRVLSLGLPTLLAGIGVSYWLYKSYIGNTEFEAQPVDFFRGWGSDVTMLLAPTRGILWLWDTLGLAVPRSSREYFGDDSVWVTTFSAVFILLGCIGFWISRHRRHAYALLILAAFGTYMSLGPSLKVYSVRPQQLIEQGNLNPLMPAELAVAPTGSAVITENLPGFNHMRASYRWMVLGLFGFWALCVLLGTELQRRHGSMPVIMLALLLIITNLPDSDAPSTFIQEARLPGRLLAATDLRKRMNEIDRDLAAPLRKRIAPGSIVAFVPGQNDFLANYLAAVGNFRTFNVGGDKNVEIARSGWPQSVRAVFASPPTELAARISDVLLSGHADYVVVPYINMLTHAHHWPPEEASVRAAVNAFAGMGQQLESGTPFEVMYDRYFAAVSLKNSRAGSWNVLIRNGD